MNKWGVRYVPAAAVKRTPQVVLAIIGLKASVAGQTSLLLNQPAQLVGCKRYYLTRGREMLGEFLGYR